MPARASGNNISHPVARYTAETCDGCQLYSVMNADLRYYPAADKKEQEDIKVAWRLRCCVCMYLCAICSCSCFVRGSGVLSVVHVSRARPIMGWIMSAAKKLRTTEPDDVYYRSLLYVRLQFEDRLAAHALASHAR